MSGAYVEIIRLATNDNLHTYLASTTLRSLIPDDTTSIYHGTELEEPRNWILLRSWRNTDSDKQVVTDNQISKFTEEALSAFAKRVVVSVTVRFDGAVEPVLSAPTMEVVFLRPKPHARKAKLIQCTESVAQHLNSVAIHAGGRTAVWGLDTAETMAVMLCGWESAEAHFNFAAGDERMGALVAQCQEVVDVEMLHSAGLTRLV